MTTTEKRMTMIFNEWAHRYAKNPDEFAEILGEDGKPVADHGECCMRYFRRIEAEMDEAERLAQGSSALLTDVEMDSLNPGIRHTVQTLRAWGFMTLDSGDGETHQFECDRDCPYVVIRVDPEKLADESHRLMELLEAQSIKFDDPCSTPALTR